jgi:hypothetical protein
MVSQCGIWIQTSETCSSDNKVRADYLGGGVFTEMVWIHIWAIFYDAIPMSVR